MKFFIFSAVLFLCGTTLIFHVLSSAFPQEHDASISNAKEPDSSSHPPVSYSVNNESSESLFISIHFPTGESKISNHQKLLLQNKFAEIDSSHKRTYTLDGFADSTGSSLINNNLLALLRSFSVYEYLIENGIAKDNIFLRTFGSSTKKNVPFDSARKVDIVISKEGRKWPNYGL